ncbi:TMEM175 family protein [Streptococcus phocae]|uniref:Ferrochelatase n=1 Tax=Streptococcus phocae TaxID=119224 RepID=A0A0N8FX20_9STRE|nr:TMEM175 family protein [Streptococcus phocae]KPJ21907.1 hypothetical protein AKK44_07360 [Streptococcus phocae]
MSSSRLEAFSDGVLAIIITIMVITLKIPTGDSLKDLFQVVPSLLAYALSFTYVAVYWNNHHHLLSAIKTVDSKVLWFNSLWLFFLSLIPWATDWLSHFYTSAFPVIAYGFILFTTAITYFALQSQVIAVSHKSDLLKKEVGKDIKGKLSLIIYLISMLVASFSTTLAILGYYSVALIWFIPDKRIAKVLTTK